MTASSLLIHTNLFSVLESLDKPKPRSLRSNPTKQKQPPVVSEEPPDEPLAPEPVTKTADIPEKHVRFDLKKNQIIEIEARKPTKAEKKAKTQGKSKSKGKSHRSYRARTKSHP